MPRPKAPEVQIGDPVAFAFHDRAHLLDHARIGGAIEQDTTSISQQPDRPIGDDKCADQTGERIHPKPTEGTGQQKSNDNQNGNGRIRHDMNDRGAHVVVAVVRTMVSPVIVLLEFQPTLMLLGIVREADLGHKSMRFGNFLA